MVNYFIIPIIIIIVLAVAVFLMRRKHIQVISKLEHEKLHIQHEPIFEEMTKVKQLNMTGETEEKFERWRSEWTEVVDVLVPKIDSLLFDTEEMVDRFRFKKAGIIEKEIEQQLDVCDKRKDAILRELNELIGSEEKNRMEMDTLKEEYREARKAVLARQHAYGRAVPALEKELEYFQPAFEEYDDLTDNGNYLQARENVIAVAAKADELFPLVETIPELLSELQTKLPATLRELRNGVSEMEEDGYCLTDLNLKSELASIEEETDRMLVQIEHLEAEPVQQRLGEIEETIDGFYIALENEVRERQFVEQTYEETAHRLYDVQGLAKEVADEALFVQQSYRLDEKEASIPKQFMSDMQGAADRFGLMTSQGEEGQTAFSVLADHIRAVNEVVDRVEEEAAEFKGRMKSLRTDELSVRNRLEELARTLQHAERRLQKANLPGIPEDIEVRLEEADEQLFIVQNGLEEVPLNMALVEDYITHAEKEVSESVSKISEMLENAQLTEQIIQYGNRYRAAHPAMHARLLEAEMAFRQFRYAKALEEAATAVEDVEPGAMKRIQDLMQERVR
ncbi:septation ring formation regulator EzrA [Sporosarcina sp. NCCP-2716]|uniref:septation ring formation regulator EzrA n=1 Tax=Sporosarcina sp. NCCP-2716 TaxID=2943679 RepID=UPI002040B655|nr:septation ring formation regulator EzrA [Sporosarcina sp. NCCP-2716]GKV69558.1 septation ring formation regulator EzrA [Sporosarcina sp. NCCP-2716]